MNLILDNFRNNASNFKDLSKNMTKKVKFLGKFKPSARNLKKMIREQGLIIEQKGIFYIFFKQADPKKSVQGWKIFPKS